MAGTTRSPFDDVNTPLPQLPEGWITATRAFLAKSNSRPQFRKSVDIKLLRENDRVFMDDAV